MVPAPFFSRILASAAGKRALYFGSVSGYASRTFRVGTGGGSMRKRFSGAVAVALLLFGGRTFTQNVSGPAKARATTPEIPFDSVPNFFKLPPGLYIGEGVGVASNSKGHVFVYSRSGETRLFEFDQTGAFVKEFAGGSYGVSFSDAVRRGKEDKELAAKEGCKR